MPGNFTGDLAGSRQEARFAFMMPTGYIVRSGDV